MANPNKKVLDRNSLKDLMKQQKSASVQNKTTINSPLAKFDKLGNLYCALCGVQNKIKNQLLWNAHLLSRTHKENVATLKSSATQSSVSQHKLIPPASQPRLATSSQAALKRKASPSTSHMSSKAAKSKSTTILQPSAGPVGGLIGYGESDSDDSDAPPPASASSSQGISTSSAPAGSLPNGLPDDFFDSKPSAAKPMAEALPEGFFDDPKADAKAREIEYKPKIEEQWELFQKQLTEETKISEALKEADDDDVQKHRDIEEIDEQIQGWSKVEDLHKRKEEVVNTDAEKMQADSDDEGSEADADELAEFLDWRTKKS